MTGRPVRTILLLGMMLCVPAVTAMPADGPTLYAPGRYLVDSATTKVHFHVKSLVGGYEGDFVQPDGMVEIDAARPDRAAIDIRFPVEKMTTGDNSTDAMLKGESFFDVAHFPDVRFQARDAPLASSEAMTAIPGELTMHGQTLPVTLSIRLTGISPDEAPGISVMHFTGSMAVERSKYGMGFGRPFVSDKVDLTIDAIFRRG